MPFAAAQSSNDWPKGTAPEIVDEGGETVMSAVSSDEYLAVFKEAAFYRYIGTTTSNFVLRFTPLPGCISKRGAANVGGKLFYVSKDGIRVIVGTESVVLSPHTERVRRTHHL